MYPVYKVPSAPHNLVITSVLLSLTVGCTPTKETDSAVEEITWTKDIQPIVEQHCVRCHQGDGQGTGDFTDFATVDAMAPLILDAIESGRMPPGSADPECHDYQDSDKFIVPEHSKDAIRAWIDGGKPFGDNADAQTYDRSMSSLENPTLIVQLQEPYTPTFTDTANPKNEYRCFALEHNQTEPFYITALHPIIDNPSMVHHVVLAKANDNGILPGSDDKSGVDCIRDGSFIGGNYQDGAMLGGWAPGMSPVRFPENAGLMVRPTDHIVIQMHYYQSETLEEGASDQSGYAFEITTEAPEHVISMFPLGLSDFTIPAGDESYTANDNFSIPVDILIWGVFPHMHVLGSGYSLSTENQCLIASDNYDFDNQLTYMYNEPVLLPANQPFDLSCTWDNSATNPNQFANPPQDVGYGERTDEEMCFVFTLASIAR